MRISVVIPAYNEEKYIGQCLDSITKYGGGRFAEIIVVDNGSTDKTAKVASTYHGVKVIYEQKKGTQNARQRGLSESNGDLVAFFDAKTRLPHGWADKAHAVFRDNPSTYLSGPFKFYDGPAWMDTAMRAIWWIFVPATHKITGYVVYGGNFIAKRRALVDAGGFDTRIVGFGDDTDTARRLSKHGKVDFKMSLLVHTSSRRFVHTGFWTTLVKYSINYVWVAAFNRPFNNMYEDYAGRTALQGR